MVFKKGYISSKKGKTFEEMYGEEKAKQLKEEHSKVLKQLHKEGKLFIPNQKGFKHSKKTKEKISEASRGHWEKLEYRKKYSKTKIKLYRNNQEYLNKLKLATARSWENKKVRKARIEARAKQILPIKDTQIEVKIQNFLKQLGIEFFTHQYMKEIEHRYQCDILIPSMNLVIECDGDYWHKYPIGNGIDHVRTKELIKKGFKVLRLWEFEIRAMDLNKFRGKLKF